MTNLVKMVFAGALLMTFLGGSALAQSKIATVNLKTLFDNYYKTKLAQASIQDRATQLDKDDMSMKADMKKAADEYQQLLEQANDQAVSPEERASRKKEADTKLKQLQDSQVALENYEREAQATLSDKRAQMRDKILVEIQATITAQAKAAGYSIVIDSASETVNATPVLVYTNGENDMTDAVLKQLNAGAPVDTTPATPAGSPMPSLLSTNSP